jgi:hypothetical protein
MNENNTRIYLALSQNNMMFPYPPDNGVGRDDGQNYGGKLLKCDLEQIEEIPEIGNDLVLKTFGLILYFV